MEKSFEKPSFRQENNPNIQIEDLFVDYIPEDFTRDPIGYVEREGKNIKKGDKKFDENDVIREDPTAVKDLPVWKNKEGDSLLTVAKIVNTNKAMVSESGDPFYEYEVLKYLHEIGLPGSRPVAKIEDNGVHAIVMERISGIRWSERESLSLKEKGYSDNDIANLMENAEKMMNELKIRFDQAGIVRTWKLKDMVFNIDIENKKIISLVPTDWERTKIIKN